MHNPVRVVGRKPGIAALAMLLCVSGLSLALAADSSVASPPQSRWVAAPAGGTRVSTERLPSWRADEASAPISRGRLVPTAFPATGFPGSDQSPNRGEVWRVHNIAPALARIADPKATGLFAEWLKAVMQSRHPGVSLVAIVDGQQLIVRAPTGLQAEVHELVEQLNFSGPDAFTHLSVVEAADPGWRRPLVRDLPAGLRGNLGQGLWLLSTARGNMVRSELAAQRRPVADLVAGTYRLRHGVPAVFDYVYPVPYTAGLQATTTPSLEPYQPVPGQMEQGMRLVILPVWRKDHSAADVYVSVQLKWIDRLHAVNTTLQIPGGTQPVTLHVPEGGEIDWTVATEWRPGRTLLISLGIHPSLQTPPPTGTLGAFARPSGEFLILADIRPDLATAERTATRVQEWQRR